MSQIDGGVIEITVNGQKVEVGSTPDTPLLWVLRDEMGLTGTRYGCGIAVCGACTVHVEGRAVRSCMMPVGTVAEQQITTIEGLASSSDELHKVQRAWLDENVSQCGFCQSGFIMAAAALLARRPQATEPEIRRALTNLCRCGTYPRVLAAVLRAAKQ